MDIFQKFLELLKIILYCLGFLTAKSIIFFQDLNLNFKITLFVLLLILGIFFYKSISKKIGKNS